VAFISGFASFLSITVKAITSPAGSGPAIAMPPPASRDSAGSVVRVLKSSSTPSQIAKHPERCRAHPSPPYSHCCRLPCYLLWSA
jgi:hypothetical protein